ncbi:DUF2786 domain-containing protein [Chitinibacter sp. ZOR0017]|uniref:DUF2786 domain-containing protein n=1 Tax=Chitinibacter sp. ZOR0017 TaxID=1339254 RepID=UPI00064684EB|nr:DUF2786 domain-containing protein [Chitinibacter sp. ZOR0017]
MDKATAISKIRKCLALSKSANEHEAAAALKMAQKLMAEFGVDDETLLAAEAAEAKARASAKKDPSKWETNLAHIVSDAFGCKLIFTMSSTGGFWGFIGCGASAEIAQYAFEVLLRQVKKERAAFTKTECKRLKAINKTRRADLFCEAWVYSVSRQVHKFAGTDATVAAIDAFIAQKYGEKLKESEVKDRNKDRKLKDKDWDAIDAGMQAGKKAQLNHGVGSQAGAQALLA